MKFYKSAAFKSFPGTLKQRQVGSNSKAERTQQLRKLLDCTSYKAQGQIHGTACDSQHDIVQLLNRGFMSYCSGGSCR